MRLGQVQPPTQVATQTQSLEVAQAQAGAQVIGASADSHGTLHQGQVRLNVLGADVSAPDFPEASGAWVEIPRTIQTLAATAPAAGANAAGQVAITSAQVPGQVAASQAQPGDSTQAEAGQVPFIRQVDAGLSNASSVMAQIPEAAGDRDNETEPVQNVLGLSGPHISIKLVSSDALLQIQCMQGTTAAQLRKAEAKLYGPGHTARLSLDSAPVAFGQALEPGLPRPHAVEIRPKKQARQLASFEILVLTGSGVATVPVEAASLLPHETIDLSTGTPVDAAQVVTGPMALDARPILQVHSQGVSDTLVWLVLKQVCLQASQPHTRIPPPSVATLLLECDPAWLP